MYFVRGRSDRSGQQIQRYISCLNYGQEKNIDIKGIKLSKYIKDTKLLINYLILPPALNNTQNLSFLRITKKHIFKKKLSSSFLNKLREKFKYKSPNVKKGCLHVAVHIRRGDVFGDNIRFLPNSYYVNILKMITRNSPRPLKIDIISQKNSCESFDIFEKEFSNITINLDDELKSCWEKMINADILICSRGAFSFVPALYNKNIVIWNRRLIWQDGIAPDNWIKYNSNNINDQLIKRLKNYQR